jgi:hypothetical protein
VETATQRLQDDAQVIASQHIKGTPVTVSETNGAVPQLILTDRGAQRHDTSNGNLVTEDTRIANLASEEIKELARNGDRVDTIISLDQLNGSTYQDAKVTTTHPDGSSATVFSFVEHNRRVDRSVTMTDTKGKNIQVTFDPATGRPDRVEDWSKFTDVYIDPVTGKTIQVEQIDPRLLGLSASFVDFDERGIPNQVTVETNGGVYKHFSIDPTTRKATPEPQMDQQNVPPVRY